MNASRFDTIVKHFANGRLTRRKAITQGGTGLAGALAAAGLARAARAQVATPGATPVGGGEEIVYLYLQAFQAGSIVPKPGEEDRFILTLEQGLGQTVYFSDRPYRIVGAVPTPQFLDTLGFPDDNPPNATLVVEKGTGETEVVVLELFAPSYDDSTHTATYEVVVLDEFERDNGFAETDANLAELLPEFGTAHLFIDTLGSCSDEEIRCRYEGTDVGGLGYTAHCYSWPGATCLPCSPWIDGATAALIHWEGVCNSTFPACGNDCGARGVCVDGFRCDPDL
jgi:hypothetical protein